MSDPKSTALLVAVTHAVKDAVQARPIVPANGGSPQWWPLVAQVMTRLTGQAGDRNYWRKLYRRRVDGLSQEVVGALAGSVAPEAYRDTVMAVVAAVEAAGAPSPVAPNANVEKPWAPPPSRSEDPEERVQERKADLLRQHDRKVASQLVDQAALTQLLVDAVTDGVRHAPPVIYRPAPDVLYRGPVLEEVPVALLSDIHGGTLVDAEEMGGLGEFNMDIFRRRLNTYQERIARAIDLHRHDAKIRRMVVYMLGDMIEGEVIFDGQAFRIELVVTDQLFEVAAYLMGWLQGILATGLVEEIHCVCIYGNHGRTTHKKGASKAHSNWDHVLYKHMQAVLANETRIKWFIPKAWFALVDVMGWRIYGTHGDAVKAWMGIPFYGIQRHDMRTTTLLQSVGEYYHFMCYGDKHVSATIPRVTGAQIMNGSIVGGSDFSLHQLGTASEPMQTLFGINEKHGKVWQYDCVLERRDPAEVRKHLAFTRI